MSQKPSMNQPVLPSSISQLPSQQGGGIKGSIFLLVFIVGLVSFTLYAGTLDEKITSKFEGKRWNIPAKVYSKPLELYQGAQIDSKALDTWLGLLHYRKNKTYKTTGTYFHKGNTYFIHTRGFSYSSNDIEKQQVIKITLADGRIGNIQSTEPSETGILRLEPVNIGGIYPDNNEDRIVVKLTDVPQPLINALIATEDRSFYQHKGVSMRGIMRALKNNLTSKSTHGGSTITQQLIKNFYLNSERTIKRKANEAIMAVLLEMHYDKEEILQTYLNEIYLGQNGKRSINGFGLASQFYFGQPLNELRIDQQALLVGLAKGPSVYNPHKHPERATKRRNVVLHNMLVTGALSQENYNIAKAQPLDIVDKPMVGKSRFPDYLDIVKRELNSVYYPDDLKNEGLKIISTLDPIAQMAADKAIDKQLKKLRGKSGKTNLQSALVSAKPATGELVAVVGSGSEFTGFNRAVDAKRQVGSLLKPVIYLTAFEQGKYNLLSPVDDSNVSVKLANNKVWSPKNYDNRVHEGVSATTALANSYNQAAVRVGMEVGVDKFIKQLTRLGIKDTLDPYPSTLLGSAELSPIDMLGVYQVFAAGGFRTPIHSIRTVVDSQGRILQRTGVNNERSISPKANFLTNHALQQVIKTGTAKKALVINEKMGEELNLAGKTGTTNDYRDAWFAGYSGNYVSVVWVGRDDNKPIGLTGGTGALPLWVDYMSRLNLAAVQLAQPEGVEWLWLEDAEGTLSNELCPNAQFVPVISEFIPKDVLANSSECAKNIYQQQQLFQQMLLEQQSLQDGSEPQPFAEAETTENSQTSNQTDGESDNQENNQAGNQESNQEGSQAENASSQSDNPADKEDQTTQDNNQNNQTAHNSNNNSDASDSGKNTNSDRSQLTNDSVNHADNHIADTHTLEENTNGSSAPVKIKQTQQNNKKDSQDIEKNASSATPVANPVKTTNDNDSNSDNSKNNQSTDAVTTSVNE